MLVLVITITLMLAIRIRRPRRFWPLIVGAGGEGRRRIRRAGLLLLVAVLRILLLRGIEWPELERLGLRAVRLGGGGARLLVQRRLGLLLALVHRQCERLLQAQIQALVVMGHRGRGLAPVFRMSSLFARLNHLTRVLMMAANQGLGAIRLHEQSADLGAGGREFGCSALLSGHRGHRFGLLVHAAQFLLSLLLLLRRLVRARRAPAMRAKRLLVLRACSRRLGRRDGQRERRRCWRAEHSISLLLPEGALVEQQNEQDQQ